MQRKNWFLFLYLLLNIRMLLCRANQFFHAYCFSHRLTIIVSVYSYKAKKRRTNRKLERTRTTTRRMRKRKVYINISRWRSTITTFFVLVFLPLDFQIIQ
ncbi:unnamed protein product [Rotaria magnacalcarata]